MQSPVVSVVTGNNADLFLAVARLYANMGDSVADLTYGKGVFWRKTPWLDVTGSDLVTVPERPYDMRATPYADNQFDIAVIDPPYIHSPGNHTTDGRYQNAATTKGILYPGIRQLYAEGMKEAMRIAKRQVWVKTKDQVQGGVQRWAHCDIYNDAVALGLYGRDLFVLVPHSQTPKGRWHSQHHARKVHSFAWVFEKPGAGQASISTLQRAARDNGGV